MLIRETDRQRLLLIDRLLRQQNHQQLEQVIVAEAARGLFTIEVLGAARALRLAPVVIYLATLGVENLPDAGGHALWLAVYQSIAKGAETEAFRRLQDRLPVKWVARMVMAGDTIDMAALARCKGKPDDWLAAFELAVDQHRFDLFERLVEQGVRRKATIEDWLNLAKMMMPRQPLLARLRDLEPLGRSYARMRGQLPAIAELANSRSLLALQAARCLAQSGDHAGAIALATQATATRDQWGRMGLLVEASCNLGDLPQTLAWLDRMVALAVSAKYMQDFKAARETEVFAARFQPQFDTGAASRALVDLQRVLGQAGQQAFLVSGTLLGYAREGGLLAHDKDVDVGIIDWENQFDVVISLLQSGLFWVETRSVGGERTYHIPVKHLATGVSIDVFIYHPEDGKLVTGVQSSLGYLQRFAFTPFTLREVDFLGIRFHVPDDVARNLGENFGNWQVSDPYYISHLESPSTMDVGGLVYQVVGRMTILQSIRDGKIAKLTRAAELMRAHREREGGMDGSLLDAVEGAAAALLREQDEVAA